MVHFSNATRVPFQVLATLLSRRIAPCGYILPPYCLCNFEIQLQNYIKYDTPQIFQGIFSHPKPFFLSYTTLLFYKILAFTGRSFFTLFVGECRTKRIIAKPHCIRMTKTDCYTVGFLSGFGLWCHSFILWLPQKAENKPARQTKAGKKKNQHDSSTN